MILKSRKRIGNKRVINLYTSACAFGRVQSSFFLALAPLIDHLTRTETARLESVGKKKYLSSFFIFFEPRSFASQLAIHAARFECKLRRSKWFHSSLPLGSGHSKIAGDCVCGSKRHTLRKMCKMKWRCFTKNRQNLNVSTYVIQVFFVVVGLRLGLHNAVG